MFTFTANASFNTNPKMKDDLIFALSNSKEVELFKAWDNMDEDGGMVSIDYDDYTCYYIFTHVIHYNTFAEVFQRFFDKRKINICHLNETMIKCQK